MAYMSQEGYDKMVAQLRHMELVDRPAASAAIAEARDKGDLSENSEYDAAKEAQAMLEMKINKLKAAIAEAKIIDARNAQRKKQRQDEIHHRERIGSQPARRQNIVANARGARIARTQGGRGGKNQDSAGSCRVRDNEYLSRITI